MIFNIQRYSTHDGPGIRTVIFLKGCSLSCLWCQNPESQSFKQQVMFDRRLAIASTAEQSVSLCPHAIHFDPHDEHNIIINRDLLTDDDYRRLATKGCPSQALTVCGYEESVDNIMLEVLKDKAFYERTQGGITLSGGEPFMQPKLAQALFEACKKAGLHTAVETCLHVPWSYITPSLPSIDLFLADLKHIDEDIFYQWTKGSARRVMKNLNMLAKTDKNLIVRIPLIQGFNADRHSIQQLIQYSAEELGVKEVHLLPYHTLGMNKYHLLGQSYHAPSAPLDDPELLVFAQECANDHHIQAILRG